MPNRNPLRLVLASASPARRKSLLAAGIDPEVLVSDVDESIVDAARGETLCLALAQLKAEAVAGRLQRGPTSEPGPPGKPGTRGPATPATAEVRTLPMAEPGTLVLGCDSVLALDGEILGKPTDAQEATRRWRQMRGRAGVLHTGHCLIDVAGERQAAAVASTEVHFAQVSDEEIGAYVATGEPLHVAGAFTIDGLGGPFVERIDGDPGTVVGVSLPLLRRLLAELGLQITDLWATSSPDARPASV